jgi:hypothetical protein
MTTFVVAGPPVEVSPGTFHIPVTTADTPPPAGPVVAVVADTDPTEPADPPTVADIAAYLGVGADLLDADLAAECLASALRDQAAGCVVSPYTVSLRYAAIRRTARRLAARQAPLGLSDLGDLGAASLPRWDAEISTAEADYLRGGFA